MRAGHRSVALFALGIWPLACAVYDDQPQSQPGDGTAGKTSNTGSSGSSGQGLSGSATAGSSSSSSSGTPSVGGTAPTSGSGGNTSPSAGSDDEGGEPSNGGSGGHGGNAGSGGSGGHGGVTNAGAANGGKSGAGGGHAGAGGAAGGGAGGTPAGGGVAGANGTAGTAGHAGSGGMPNGPLCSDHLLTARATWVPTASDFDATKSGVVTNLLDNKITRWSTGKPQAGDEWLQIDFGQTVTINHVNLQQGDDINDYPRGYAVIVSDTPNDLSGSVRLTGMGKSGVSTAISLPQLASGRYLLIKQTGTSLSWWSAEEIEVSCAD